jgi:ABC-type multidrug transport system permease subunit
VDPSKILASFGYAMAVLFVLMGIFVLFFLPPEFNISEKFRVMFGVVLLLYGSYRAISIHMKQRQQEDEDS